MKLKEICITENANWQPNPGQYTAKIKYEGQNGAIEMRLDEKVSEALLICIGETITAFAAKAAQQVQSNIIASINEAKKPQLEAKTVEG